MSTKANPNPNQVVSQLLKSSAVSRDELGSLTSLLDSTLPLAEALLDPLLPQPLLKEVEEAVMEVSTLVSPLEALGALFLL